MRERDREGARHLALEEGDARHRALPGGVSDRPGKARDREGVDRSAISLGQGSFKPQGAVHGGESLVTARGVDRGKPHLRPIPPRPDRTVPFSKS